jgi:hypothetical protein
MVFKAFAIFGVGQGLLAFASGADAAVPILILESVRVVSRDEFSVVEFHA